MGLLMLMGDSGFNVRSELFGAGEQGAWYDPSDFSTMWQDSGKTTPVTAAGDPVGYIADKSGRGNDAYQTTSGQRPTLQTSGGLWYLSFDGSDDSLVTNSVDFTATDEMTVIAGVRKLSDAARGCIVELSNSYGNTGAFGILGPGGASPTYEIGANGTPSTGSGAYVPTGYTAPVSNVLSASYDLSGANLAAQIIPRLNGVLAQSGGVGTAIGGNFRNDILYIGRRGSSSLPFNGHLYQLIIRGKTTPTGKLLEAERFVARKTGVTF